MSRAARAVILCCVTVLLLPWVAYADTLPPSAFVEGLVGHPQEHNLSCESRSATDLAAFWGVTFAEDRFFRRLPKSDNPYRGFLGDVDLPAGSMPPVGYGVYVGPIAANLRSWGLYAQARQGWSLDGLKAELVAGRPVIIWATYDMQLPGAQTWVSSDGLTSVVVKWQHTFIAVGYDEGGIYLVDAYDGVTKHFSYEAFVPAWDQLGRMAVTSEQLLPQPRIQPGGRVWRATEIDGRRQFVVDGRWMVGPD
ncbi:MAG: C39 family peptidase [Chloroflexota bacterium]|nr:C39 family peptidase [Chloroflexota bacterium]